MKKLLAGCAALLGATVVARAGVVIHQSVVLKDTGGGRESIVYVQDGMLRSEQHDARGHLEHFIIIRDNAIWQVDARAQKYTKMDRAMMEQMNARIPPQFRAMMEKMRGEHAPSKEDGALHDSGKTEHIGQYTCNIWEGAPAGFKQELCVVPFNALPGGSELSATMKQVGRTVTDVMSNSFLGGSSKDIGSYGRLNGIAVLTRDEFGETRLKSIEQKSLSPDTFRVPQGYEQQQMPFGAGSHARDQ